MRLILAIFLFFGGTAYGQIVLSANENKIDLSSGGPTVVPDPEPDNLTLLDFSQSPPRVQQLPNIPNSVLGPPSTVALTPDERMALVASPLKIDPADSTRTIPDDKIRVIDLQSTPPAVVEILQVGRQPSGIAISPDGRLALVANRADGSVSLLSIERRKVTLQTTVQVGGPGDEICDVSISPSLDLVLATNRTQKQVHLFRLAGLELTPLEVLTVFGAAYHSEITPDGELAVVAGGGVGTGTGALTVVDLKTEPLSLSDAILIGTEPESFDISPDGLWIAAVLMDYSNAPPDSPRKTQSGQLVLLERSGRTFERRSQKPIGPIPQGVTFTPDGKHLVIQSHLQRQIQIFSFQAGTVSDPVIRIEVPGRPSSIRAAERALN